MPDRVPLISDGLDRFRDPGTYEDPYQHFAHLRAQSPVAFSSRLGVWVVTSYEAVRQVLRDHETFSSADLDRARASTSPSSALAELVVLSKPTRRSLIASDPPEHTRLRRDLNRAFVSAEIARLAPMIEKTAAELVSRDGSVESFDVIAGVARPLPVAVLSTMMSLPPSDWDRVAELVRAFAPMMNLANDNPRAARAGDSAMAELLEYFHGAIVTRRRSLDDDLVSRLVRSQTDPAVIVETCVNFVIGGFETPLRFIGNLVHALATHEDQLEAVRADPTLVDRAIDEVMRWNPPVTSVTRTAARETVLSGVSIPEGDVVEAVVGAANRDPRLVANPDVFDVRRSRSRHLGLGVGVHYCIGAALGRVEAAAALRPLLQDFPTFTLATDYGWKPIWSASLRFRGLESLLLQN